MWNKGEPEQACDEEWFNRASLNTIDLMEDPQVRTA